MSDDESNTEEYEEYESITGHLSVDKRVQSQRNVSKTILEALNDKKYDGGRRDYRKWSTASHESLKDLGFDELKGLAETEHARNLDKDAWESEIYETDRRFIYNALRATLTDGARNLTQREDANGVLTLNYFWTLWARSSATSWMTRTSRMMTPIHASVASPMHHRVAALVARVLAHTLHPLNTSTARTAWTCAAHATAASARTIANSTCTKANGFALTPSSVKTRASFPLQGNRSRPSSAPSGSSARRRRRRFLRPTTRRRIHAPTARTTRATPAMADMPPPTVKTTGMRRHPSANHTELACKPLPTWQHSLPARRRRSSSPTACSGTYRWTCKYTDILYFGIYRVYTGIYRMRFWPYRYSGSATW